MPADRVDVALLGHASSARSSCRGGARRRPRRPRGGPPPGRAHASDRVDRARADLVAALDQLDELVDDGARLGDVGVVALDRQPVAAQAGSCSAAARAARRARRRRPPASSAATSFETERTSCTRLSVGAAPGCAGAAESHIRHGSSPTRALLRATLALEGGGIGPHPGGGMSVVSCGTASTARRLTRRGLRAARAMDRPGVRPRGFASATPAAPGSAGDRGRKSCSSFSRWCFAL